MKYNVSKKLCWPSCPHSFAKEVITARSLSGFIIQGQLIPFDKMFCHASIQFIKRFELTRVFVSEGVFNVYIPSLNSLFCQYHLSALRAEVHSPHEHNSNDNHFNPKCTYSTRSR